MYKTLPLFILSICISFIACNKDQSLTPNSNPNQIIFEASFNGIVTDIDGAAIEGATVSIGNQSVTTDDYGYFYIQTEANENGTFIKVKNTGYFDGYGNVLPSDNRTTHVKFKLKQRTAATIINSTDPVEINMNDNMVKFAANSFIDQNGNPYDGDVSVYMDYIDPSDDNFGEVMPGDMNATSASNESGILKSFGMLNVELFGDDGQSLDINQAATLHVEIPDDFINNAPSEIPMWYFDDETGLWVEEGIATKVGDHYETTVNHFTLWNCDEFFGDPIVLSGQVISRSPLSNFRVQVTWVSLNDSRDANTDNEGYFSGLVPPNETLLIEVIDQCNNVLSDLSVGPLTQDQFYEIYVDPNTYNTVLVEGNVKDCEGSNVSNGYVVVSFGNENQFILTDNQGDFSTSFVNCEDVATVSIHPIDINHQEIGAISIHEINNSEVQSGILEACGDGFISGLYATLDDGTSIKFPFMTALRRDTIVENSSVPMYDRIDFTVNVPLDDGTFLEYTFVVAAKQNPTQLDELEWFIFTNPDVDNWTSATWWNIGTEPIVNGSLLETAEHFIFRCDLINITHEPSEQNYTSSDFILIGRKQ